MSRKRKPCWNSADLLEMAMGLLCNVNGGCLTNESNEWKETFDRFIYEYHKHLNETYGKNIPLQR